MKQTARRVFDVTAWRRRFFALAVLLFVLALGAGPGCRRTYGRQVCRLEREHVIGASAGEASALDLKVLRDGSAALAWSMGETTHLAVLNRALQVTAGPFDVVKTATVVSGLEILGSVPKTFWRPQQAAPIAAADIAVSELPGGAIAVATIEASSPTRGGGAFVMKIDPKSSGEPIAKRVGGAGRHATTLSAVHNDKRLVVAWHEGRGGASRIRIALLSTEDLDISSETSLEPGEAVFHPHLLAFEGDFILAYVQTVEGEGASKSDVVLARLDAKGQLYGRSVVARSRFLAAEPRLVRSASGLGVVYRDDEERDGQAEYFFLPISDALEPQGPAARISRSDGYQGPRVVAKDGLLVGATIRSFQRSLLVGLNRFDARGRKKGGEFQVYADDASFVRVDLATQASQTILAYLEEKESRSRVLVSKVSCAEAVSP